MASEATSRKLKLPNKLSLRQMYMLQNEAGYTIVAEDKDSIELTRPFDFVHKSNQRYVPEISEAAKNQLRARLNNIVNIYADPDANQLSIMTRIKNMQKTLTSLECDFVDEWVERNINE